MRKPIGYMAAAVLLLAVAAGVAGYFVPVGYLQSLLAGASTSLASLAIAIVAVNVYLTSSEKTEAAAPLVKLIMSAMSELHNELFIRHWKTEFGIEKMKGLINVYQSNKRNPAAFSPADRDLIHAAIIKKSADLLRVYDLLIDQFRELTMITGWSFDPAVTASALEARLNFVKFKSLVAAVDPESKSQLIETYLDGEAAASSVLRKLMSRLGQAESAWQRDV